MADQAVDLAYAEALVARRVRGHELPPPWPIHYHGASYIVDEMCQCGKPRSKHEDTQEYGRGPGMDGECPKFRWHGWIESAWHAPTKYGEPCWPGYNENRTRSKK